MVLYETQSTLVKKYINKYISYYGIQFEPARADEVKPTL